ncbi:hypothetical protein DL771_005325 [Monosporascus sp. 5C6A]|nr:hypothetical protein DL771_005325 [Monosporascus sp. 5C6A]
MPEFPVTNGVTTFREPPEGYVVNFANPQQQLVLEHYLVFGIGGTLAFLAMLQRVYSKIFLYSGLQINDGFMFLAWVSQIRQGFVAQEEPFANSGSLDFITSHADHMRL